MAHFASRSFWSAYHELPLAVRNLADRNYALLEENPQHPSLHFKKTGRYWSVRVGISHRALGVPAENGIVWFWIGTHAEYDVLIRS
jgi:hypothetical protein